MAARITDIFPFLLITLLCVGIVEGGYQALEYFVLQSPVEEAAVPATVSVEKKSMVKDAQQKPLDYRVILQRNLFGPPPGEGAPATTAAPDVTEDIQLTSLNIVLMGTISGGDGVDRAIILDQTSKKQELYEQGDVIQGAMVKEILRGKVILFYNGKDEMLDMSEAANVRPAYAAPAAQPGAVRNGPSYRPAVSPGGTPRRVINRPRTIRPSRTLRTE
ncbi:type II secretion system protein N [Desulfocastanea catecholica]